MPRLAAAEYRQLLDVESARLGRITPDQLTRPIAHLEGWTVQSLIGHTAWICRFFALSVQADPDDPPPRSSVGEPPLGAEVLDWYQGALDEMNKALANVALDAVSPTWTGPQPTSWWLRRLSHELAMHRWDAYSAIDGEPDPINATHALDGIDEILEVFVPNRLQFVTLGANGETIHLHTTDMDDGEWLLTLGPTALQWERAHAKGDVAARGSASDLLLMLWSRIEPARLEVFGDESLLHRWQEAAKF